MRDYLYAASALALVLPAAAWAQTTEEDARILVSASRSSDEVLEGQYAGSVSVLTAEDLQLRQVRDVADALRDVPGIAVSSVAGQTQLRLRGSEANHVLVLVDGIEVSDPFAGEFDIGTLQAELGSSVEVLRGPQSALYGSDAIGGVVAYRSASGRDAPGISSQVEIGSFGTINAAARAGLAGANHDFALNATLVSTDGQPNARGGTRDIGRDSRTISAKGSYTLAPGFELRAAGRYVETEGQFNDQDFNSTSPTFGLVIDSPDTRFRQDAIYALVGLKGESLNGRWTHDLSGQIADITRDSYGPFGRSFGNKGQRLKGSYVSTVEIGGPVFAHSVTFAADIERESFRNTDPFGFAFTGQRTARNIGLVGEYRATSELFDFSAAVRRDLNNRFADETTFRLAGAARIGAGTRIRGAYGTGIKNPGFYELYGFVDGRFIGNADLSPEKSEGWEIGLDQSFADDAIQISATWFDSELQDEIFTSFPAPDFIATPANRDTVSTQQGLELSLRARLGPQFSFDAAYSWLDAEEDGVEEVRRPANIASAALTWSALNDAASATLIVRHNGATDDVAFTDPSFIPVTVRLDDYTLVNLAAEVRLDDHLRIFGRVENLLDESYEQVFSFVSPGRSVIAGFRLSI
ncbi:MAG: TonB-dependent receptor [Sphingomonadales bacterium]|nr:MAG: TonB-dependent receptor [Sphingomonadales bacterium]